MLTLNENKVIHIGRIVEKGGKVEHLILKEKSPGDYVWYQKGMETAVSASTIEEAIRLARREWKLHSFRTLNCGFRYTLPERDEHGVNALFCEMAESYNSPTSVYFDPNLGHNCHVKFASREALDLLESLKKND